MSQRTAVAGLSVANELFEFIENKALTGLDVRPDQFWGGLAELAHDLGPKNRSLVAERTSIQAKIDGWHIERRGQDHDAVAYKAFLKEIGYLVPDPEDFEITTENVDPEIASIPGPQLVVPIMNARYALNAANARWGSLYDALYGTDIIPDISGATKSGSYNPERGKKVIEYTKNFLDKTFPLSNGSWKDVSKISIDNILLKNDS